MDKLTVIGMFIEALIFCIPIGALLVKYGKVLSMIENHDKEIEKLKLTNQATTPLLSQINENSKDIEDLKETQRSYQSVIEKSLDEIKQYISAMNTSLTVLTARLDYVEKDKNGTH